MKWICKKNTLTNYTFPLVYEFDLRRKMSKLGFDFSLDKMSDYELEIFYLISSEFLRFENEEFDRMKKKKR